MSDFGTDGSSARAFSRTQEVSRRILVVVPSPLFNPSLADHAVTLGYSVDVEQDIQKAISLLGQNSYDLIFLGITSYATKEIKLLNLLIRDMHRDVGVLTPNYIAQVASMVLGLGAKFYVKLPLSKTYFSVLLHKHAPTQVRGDEREQETWKESDSRIIYVKDAPNAQSDGNPYVYFAEPKAEDKPGSELSLLDVPDGAGAEVLDFPHGNDFSDGELLDLPMLNKPEIESQTPSIDLPNENVPQNENETFVLPPHIHDPTVEEVIRRKTMEAKQIEVFVKAYEACVAQMDRIWADQDMYQLMNKISKYYEGAEISLMTHSKTENELRMLLNTSHKVDRDVGDLVEDRFDDVLTLRIQDSVRRLMAPENASPLEFFVHQEKQYACFPLVDHRNFMALLLICLGTGSVNQDDLLYEIKQCFKLDANLKKSMVGKYSLVQIYRQFFIPKK